MEPKKPFQFEKIFEVLSFQIDPSGKLRWSSLGDLLQEVAWKHADSRGFGQKLFDMGFMWVLSRLEIKVNRMPSWGETITVKTAGRGISGLFALREFEVTDQEGHIITVAMSAWLLLDVKTKRPQRPGQVLPSELFAPTDDTSLLPQKITITEIKDTSTSFRVRASDLDMNNHVNNVSYIRWVEDYTSEHNLAFKNMLINYVTEAWLGNEIVLKSTPHNGKMKIEGGTEGKKIFFAEIF